MGDTATARKIKQTLGTIMANPLEGDAVVLATVVSVDEQEATCVVDPIDESAQLFDVRLQAETGSGILIIPKLGSTVVVTMINNINGHVTMFSQAEKIIFMDGSYDGLVKAKELTDKLNNLEKAFNDFVLKYNSHVQVVNVVTTCPAGSGTGTGTAVAPAIQEETVLIPTDQSEIENELIKHGKN